MLEPAALCSLKAYQALAVLCLAGLSWQCAPVQKPPFFFRHLFVARQTEAPFILVKRSNTCSSTRWCLFKHSGWVCKTGRPCSCLPQEVSLPLGGWGVLLRTLRTRPLALLCRMSVENHASRRTRRVKELAQEFEWVFKRQISAGLVDDMSCSFGAFNLPVKSHSENRVYPRSATQVSPEGFVAASSVCKDCDPCSHTLPAPTSAAELSTAVGGACSRALILQTAALATCSTGTMHVPDRRG